MKYAIIGCGRIAKNHLAAALACKLDIAAVCDALPLAMSILLAKDELSPIRNACRYTDYRRMLCQISPTIVAVATDSGSHAQIALDCIAAGAHVILEKPMALSLSDANRIIAAAKAAGIKVAVCHQNRFNEASKALHKAISENKFGKISHAALAVRWNRNEQYYAQAQWRGRWLSDGGALMNQCIHGIDMLHWMLGDVKSVYGVCQNRFHPFIEAEDVGMAVLTFKSGAVATLEGSTNIYPENLEQTLCLFGENATVKLGGKSSGEIECWRFADGTPPPVIAEHIKNVYGNGHIRLYEDMLLAIKEDREPLISAKEGRAALELVLAVYKSQREGAAVELPLKDFSCGEMAGLFKK